VSVGHRKAGAHLYWLAAKGWKGILDPLRRERAAIRQILGGGGP
jgi:hypothetical protein